MLRYSGGWIAEFSALKNDGGCSSVTKVGSGVDVVGD